MKKFNKKLSIILLFALMLSLFPASLTFAQGQVTCEQDAVVQADDWLSKLADKSYGDPLAFAAIFEATNAKAASDDSYAVIASPDFIEVGWKLCIPSAVDAENIIANSIAPIESAVSAAGAAVRMRWRNAMAQAASSSALGSVAAATAAPTGKRSRTRVPPESSRSQLSSPPWRRTSRSASVRPSPR